MNNVRKKDLISIQGAAKKIKVKRYTVEDWINEGILECIEGKILLKSVEEIIKENEKYISLESFLKGEQNDRFDARYVYNRNKYIDYLEINDFFGIDIVYPEDMLYPFESSASFYFLKTHIEELRRQSIQFFKFFGMKEEEICSVLVNECAFGETKKQLNEYLKRFDSYTPIVTEFVKVTTKKDITMLKEADITNMIADFSLVGSKDIFIDFVDFVRQSLDLGIGRINRKRKNKTKEIGAYPYRIYVSIAKAIFNEDNIVEHGIIEKSFDNSFDFEMWLYLSIHFVCGWRSQDICNNWQYLDKEISEELCIDVENIKENVINKCIDEAIYLKIGEYIEKRIELKAVKPHKTAKANDLLAPIGNELKVFFGRMALISLYLEKNHLGGHLKPERASEYLNYVRIRALFGDDIYKLLGRNNIQSRKLNKSYLQSIEDRAKRNGAGTMTAYILASYARNHSNVDTTAIYIYDHGLSGETAEVVLSMMLDRGVFGTILYKELLGVFPEVFDTLSAKEQTKLMAECEVSAYELEMIGSDLKVESQLISSFSEGNSEKAYEILAEMFEISQGFGKGKDKGIYCKKRALGYACERPTFESCLANVCPHLVFTEAGIKSLITVINDYMEKAKKTGNPKYEVILNKVLIPSYKNILKDISKRMSPEEEKALKVAIGVYNGKHVSENRN